MRLRVFVVLGGQRRGLELWMMKRALPEAKHHPSKMSSDLTVLEPLELQLRKVTPPERQHQGRDQVSQLLARRSPECEPGEDVRLSCVGGRRVNARFPICTKAL